MKSKKEIKRLDDVFSSIGFEKNHEPTSILDAETANEHNEAGSEALKESKENEH